MSNLPPSSDKYPKPAPTPEQPQQLWGQKVQESADSPLTAVSDSRLMQMPQEAQSLLDKLKQQTAPLMQQLAQQRRRAKSQMLSPVALGHPL